MIHCQHSIKTAVVLIAEESVGRKRSETVDTFILTLIYGRLNDLLLLISHKPVITRMRIQRQNCYSRYLNIKIGFQRVLQNRNLALDKLFV
ncbi:MAG: hypothetical protein BWY95_02788 [Bacteroidetes bacterium ADurb.BinA104]|nr:MAG: hypothetical protein BWY95_02788 [Bacteroidetes bacterium ADurb.BinA104]